MKVNHIALARAYWLGTGILLVGGHFGNEWGIPGAIALTAIHAAHFRVLGFTLTSLPLQVRLVYLAMLIAGLWPPLAFLHWIQCVGIWANILADYCLLARLLSLAPWHRKEPLTGSLVTWTLLSRPRGNFLQRRARRFAPLHRAAGVPQ